MLTCASCGNEAPGEFAFCQFCGAALAEEPAAAVREERKVVSVLFCDLVGFTAVSEAADPEDVRARLRPYHARLRQEIERYGGTVEKFIGDAVMAVFGAPVAHEDDAERAVRSGLRILEAIEELNETDFALPLQVRVGINAGEAVVALGARPEEGEGIVTGDVVNTASRLQGAAPVNGIACSEVTFRATERIFDYEELEAVEVKGKAEPLARFRPRSAKARFGADVTRARLTGRRQPSRCPVGSRSTSTTNGGSEVARVVITHAVEEIDRWLAGSAGRAAAIESGTGSNVTDYVAADGSNNIAVTADVADVDALKGMLASPPPEVLAAMQEHGVVQPITAYIEA